MCSKGSSDELTDDSNELNSCQNDNFESSHAEEPIQINDGISKGKAYKDEIYKKILTVKKETDGDVANATNERDLDAEIKQSRQITKKVKAIKSEARDDTNQSLTPVKRKAEFKRDSNKRTMKHETSPSIPVDDSYDEDSDHDEDNDDVDFESSELPQNDDDEDSDHDEDNDNENNDDDDEDNDPDEDNDDDENNDDDEDSGDDEDSDDVDFEYSKLPQSLSIQWIDLKKVRYKLLKDRSGIPTLDDLSKMIQKIIDMRNTQGKKTKKGKEKNIDMRNTQRKKTKKGKEKKLYIEVSNPDNKQADFLWDTKDYRVKAYFLQQQCTEIIAKVTLPKEELENTQSYNFIYFFYQTEPYPRIISATSNRAWKVVLPFVDYTFPTKIGTKVGDCTVIKEIVMRSLFGECAKKKLWFPYKSSFYDTSYLYNVIESFTCQIDCKSDLSAKLAEIENSLLKQPDPSYHITVSTTRLRIMKRLAIPHGYANIFNLFTDYMQNPIRDYGENRFKFLRFMQPPSLSKKELDDSLMKHIYDAYKQNGQPLVFIRHKFLEDFLYYQNFKIDIGTFKNPNIKVIKSNPPEIEEIMNIIFNEKTNLKIKSFKSIMRKAKLKFTDADLKPCDTEKLLSCIEGELHHSDGNSYFKLRNCWHGIEASHLVLLHQDFSRVYSDALITEDSPGFLPLPWKRDPGKLTLKLLKERGLPNIILHLKSMKVRYVDEDCVKQKSLCEEILKNEVISRNKDSIEEILNEPELSLEDDIKEEFNGDAEIILKELRKKRKVITEKGQKKEIYVVNPFPYPLKKQLKEKYASLEQLLFELYEKSVSREDEGAYNARYVEELHEVNKIDKENGYLFFDKILPNGIESCDILKYSKEKVYLYHVKGDLGQHTREVCSQILNAAESVRSALSTNHSDNYLHKLWHRTKNCNYKNKTLEAAIKNQLDRIGNIDEFTNIFRNRKVVFVYAHCPEPNRCFSKVVKNPSNISKGRDTRLMKMLIELGYLSKFGRLTEQFFSVKEKDFKLQGEFEKCSKKVFKELKFSDSTIAKMEIVRIAHNIQALGFDFKICEIVWC